jgi:hypothetical protein
LVDFPTPPQRTELKKEARRREARGTLTTWGLPPEESYGPFSDRTLLDLRATLLAEGNELVLVRGVARGRRKDVFSTAAWLCEEMEELMTVTTVDGDGEDGDDAVAAADDEDDDEVEDGDNEEDDDDVDDDDDDDVEGAIVLPVALLSTRGHTALIYCPTLPVDHPDKFVLRTSVGQKNVWRARVKAPRDHRGQIIKVPKDASNNNPNDGDDE